MMHYLLALFAIQLFTSLALAQLHPSTRAVYAHLPSLREQAKIQNGWREERRAKIPSLLEKYRVDGWLMSQREHAEEPIWTSIINATDYDAHRRTVVFFHRGTDKSLPNPVLWVDNTGDVWPELTAALERLGPERIVLNIDKDIAFAGGLAVGEHAALSEGIGEEWMKRTVNVPMLAIEYVSTKAEGQFEYYRYMQEIVWAMIEEGFSSKQIVPNETTTEDLEWWFREKILERNLTTWNHPRVSVITEESFPGWSGTQSVVQPGDVLHIDWGISAMGMNTDTQHMAYVLRPNETDAPDSLKAGLAKANRMQDIHLDVMRAGMTGDEVLQECLKRMKEEGIEGQVFSHPIGDWGHDAGAVVGFTNFPTHVPVLGELPVLPGAWYSIELYAYHFVPERNETLRFRIEEDAYWDEDTERWQFVRGRQEHFHLVGEHADPSPVFHIQSN